MAFQILTGTITTLPASMSIAAQEGWLVFGGLNQSGATYSVLMGRGDGVSGSVLKESVPYTSLPGGTSSLGVYPPQSTINFNTNPNSTLEDWRTANWASYK